MNVLVLGATGLLGNAMFRVLSEQSQWSVYGTARSEDAKRFFVPELARRLVAVDDLANSDQLVRLFDTVQPRVVVNCVAVGKAALGDQSKCIAMFAVLPHRVAHLCRLGNARLVQISSDGVFSGSRGGYTEDDLPDAVDIYGIAKLLGELGEPHTITLRTSMIGHELQTRNGLLEWFLAQTERCTCFTRAIFSGFPTVVLAQVVRDVVMRHAGLQGVYHVATKPISKFDLLRLVAEQYHKKIVMIPDDKVAIDRSLIADRFKAATGYVPPDWPELVRIMSSYRYGLART